MIVPVSASVTLTRLHPWHWLSVIYTQYLCAPVTLTICTRDIDLTECDLHSVPAFVRLTILHSWHWPFYCKSFGPLFFVYYLRPPLVQGPNTNTSPKKLTKLHMWHLVGVIYPQYQCAPVTLTICIRDIDWVWFTLSPCICEIDHTAFMTLTVFIAKVLDQYFCILP